MIETLKAAGISPSVLIGFVIFFILMIGIGIFFVRNGAKMDTKTAKAQREKKYTKSFDFLSSNFLTQRQALKIYNQLATLSIYSKAELRMYTTKYFLMSTGISVGLILVSVILFKDTVSVLIGIAFALLVNNVLVTKQVEKTNLAVYKALRSTLASIRQEYLRLDSIPEAISEAEIDPLLRKPMDEIYQILVATDSELRLMKFYETSPFRSIQTFAGVCYNINNSGDSKDAHGQSNFVQALTMLTSDVNAEITRLVNQKTRFGIIEYLTFVPIFAMNFIESYFEGIMPGTAMIYNGMIGYLGRILTLMSCIVSYLIITNINQAVPLKEDDRIPFTNKLIQNNQVYNFIWQISPKNARRRKLDFKLKRALSRKSVEHVYIEKVVFSAMAFVISLIVAISVVTLGREFTITSTQQLSLVATNEMDEYSNDTILAMDYEYFSHGDDVDSWNLDAQIAFVRGYMPTLTDLQAQDQISRMNDKREMMKNAYFHWQYMLLVIGCTIGAWFIPNGLIWFRRLIVRTEVEDDFLQLQTLMAIIMNTNADTIDALYQLAQHSRIHRDMLLYCYHAYPSDPEKELQRLQSKTQLLEFKRFIGKLQLTISDLSLAEAYSDLIMERDYMIRLREIQINATIDKKRGLCGPVSLAPIAFMVVFEFLIPLGYLGIKEFTDALSSMGNM